MTAPAVEYGISCCPTGVPHLWAVGPDGWLCVVGQHTWQDTLDPFGPCTTAMPWAVNAIRQAERDSQSCTYEVIRYVTGIHR